MSVTSNTMTLSVATRSVFPDAHALIDSTIDWTQGGFIWLDTATQLLKPLTVETQSASFAGVAPVTLVDGKYPPAYLTDVDASVGEPSIPGPQYGSAYQCKLKAGDAIVPGQFLYADPATGVNGVTVTVGTAVVGVYQGKALTAAAGGTVISAMIRQAVISNL